jgi:hypothetical protein
VTGRRRTTERSMARRGAGEQREVERGYNRLFEGLRARMSRPRDGEKHSIGMNNIEKHFMRGNRESVGIKIGSRQRRVASIGRRTGSRRLPFLLVPLNRVLGRPQ